MKVSKSTEKKETSRTYEILVYGIDKKKLTLPMEDIKRRNFNLVFEPFDTKRRFDEFDGVILFQGIFESFEKKQSPFLSGTFVSMCEQDELDKRKKEVSLLLSKKGFLCFVLCEPFVDYADGNCKSTDLAKIYLNYDYSFSRKNFDGRSTYVESKRNEFKNFLERYGAANSYFQNLSDRIELRVIAEVDGYLVGMVMWDKFFFIPSLIPGNTSENIEEYFTLLSEALISACNKLIYEIPAWVDSFEFTEEVELKEKREQLLSKVGKFGKLIESLRRFKRILLVDGDLLVEAVIDVLRNGFKFTVDEYDDYREDLKILDELGEPMIFGEIKGTNKSVKREHINQCDSHRERAELPSDFPSILIINTHIKNSRSISEKDKEIAKEQIKHAVRNNVLILRTLDLLRLLERFLAGQMSESEVVDILKSRCGWLKLSDGKCEIVEN